MKWRTIQPALLLLLGSVSGGCSPQAARLAKSCPPPISKREAYQIAERALADSLLRKELLLNGPLDSATDHEFFALSGHFTDTLTCSFLVLVNTPTLVGAGGGNADNLLLLLDADKRIKAALQVGDIVPTDVQDVSADGVPEFRSHEATYFHGSRNRFTIANFQGGHRHLLYAADSYEMYEPVPFSEVHRPGDTIEAKIKSRLIDPDGDGHYAVRQTRTFHLYRGGDEAEAAHAKAQVIGDSSTIPLR